MKYEAVYRTAPATPALLITFGVQRKYPNYYVLLVLVLLLMSVDISHTQ